MMSKEAMKLALEGAANYIDTLGGDSRKYRQALANEALERMADNARELGLDYDVKSDHRLMEQPAQRTWVGLTDEEQTQVAWSCGAMSADWLDFASAIEAKLKEKNT